MTDSKEKKTTSMKDRLSKFLGIPIEEKSGPDLSEIIKVYEQSKEADKKIIAELLKTLNKSNPIDVRMATVKDFCAFIRTHRYVIKYTLCFFIQNNAMILFKLLFVLRIALK